MNNDMTKGENVRGFNFTVTEPTPIEKPKSAGISQECMDLIGLDTSKFGKNELANFLCGN
jgi:hypothetical protein